MITKCSENLLQGKAFSKYINAQNYSTPNQCLFGGSPEADRQCPSDWHTCSFQEIEEGVVSYNTPLRLFESYRNTRLVPAWIENKLMPIHANRPLTIKANYTGQPSEDLNLKSSRGRELWSCIKHNISHLAIVKIDLKEMNCLDLINKNFGIAPSTLRYQKQCVQ